VRVIGSCLARVFKETTKVEIEGFEVERRETRTPRNDGDGYFASKSYVFSRVTMIQLRAQAVSTRPSWNSICPARSSKTQKSFRLFTEHPRARQWFLCRAAVDWRWFIGKYRRRRRAATTISRASL